MPCTRYGAAKGVHPSFGIDNRLAGVGKDHPARADGGESKAVAYRSGTHRGGGIVPRAAHDRRAVEAFRLAAEFHLQETAPENSC